MTDKIRGSEAFDCVLLGSGGWMPTPSRATSCLLVRDGHNALLLDAGTGVAAICRQRELLQGADRLDVVLSHFHLDHVAGLTYLPALAADLQLTIWAPGQLLREVDSRDILQPARRRPRGAIESRATDLREHRGGL